MLLLNFCLNIINGFKKELYSEKISQKKRGTIGSSLIRL